MNVRRLHRFLRASFLALLVLGLVVKPVMLSIGDAHAIEHALLAAGDAHGGHDHGDHDDDGQPGNDHTQGAHGLMHQGAGPSFAPIATLVTIALVHLPRIDLPPADGGPDIGRTPTSPFRPPIA